MRLFEREVLGLTNGKTEESSARIKYVRYIYENIEKYPTAFESFVFPIAIYDNAGTIIKATMLFNELAGITEDEINQRKVNISDCLNYGNAGLSEATHSVFNDTEKVLHGLVRPLNSKTAVTKSESAIYTGAVFFPMTYKGKHIEYGAVLLYRNEREITEPETADDG